MQQSTLLVGALIVAFIFWLAIHNRLGAYYAIIGGTAAPGAGTPPATPTPSTPPAPSTPLFGPPDFRRLPGVGPFLDWLNGRNPGAGSAGAVGP